MTKPIRTADMIKGNILTREVFYPEDVCTLTIYALQPNEDRDYLRHEDGSYIKERLREVHYKSNRVHRQNGPAEVTYSDGFAQTVLYKQLDCLHRLQGPARLVFGSNLEIMEQEWWLYGVRLSETEHTYFTNAFGADERPAAVQEFASGAGRKGNVVALTGTSNRLHG